MKYLSLSLFSTVCFFLLLVAPVRAQLDQVANQSALGNVVVRQINGQTSPTELGPHFRGGDSVVASDEYNGDLYIGGGTIQVPGTVNGDLIAAGGSISLDGTVTEDVRISGGNIVINGDILGEVTVFGGTITFTQNSTVGGSVVVFGGSVTMQGSVQGNVYGAAGTTTLAGRVGENVRFDSGSLTIPETASISGSLLAVVGQNSEVSPDARITGYSEVKVREEKQQDSRKEEATALFGAGIVGQFIFGSLMAIAGGSLLLYVVPSMFNRLARIIEDNPLTTGAWGLIYIFLIPLLVIFLMVTVIGIPIAFITLFIWIINIIVAGWITAYVVGRMVENQGNADWMSNPFTQLIIGVLVLNLIGIVPIIGWIVKFVAFVLGMGALLVWTKAQIQIGKPELQAVVTKEKPIQRVRVVTPKKSSPRLSRSLKRTKKS